MNLRVTLRLCLALILWAAAAGWVLAEDGDAQGNPGAPGRILVLLRMPPQHLRPGGDTGDSYGDSAGRNARRRIADRVAKDHGLTLVGDWPMPLLGLDCFIMRTSTGQSPGAAAANVSHDRGVAWAEPMQLYYAEGDASKTAPPTTAKTSNGASHNDPLFLTQPAARGWRLAELHEIATGKNVRVAVIDSGVEKNHPDLAGQIDLSQDFTSRRRVLAEQHGTGVAGVIAARADNGLGIVGIAPGVRLMALRACWQAEASAATVCDSLSLAQALHFAIAHHAQVINLSLSGPPDPLLGRLIDIALVQGATVVGAVDPNLPVGGFPASHPGVVAVRTDSDATPISGIVSAPGRDVPTTQPGGRWFLVNGSSYAAAHISGLFALLRERGGGSGVSALVAVRPGGEAVNACATLLRASGPCDCGCAHDFAANARR